MGQVTSQATSQTTSQVDPQVSLVHTDVQSNDPPSKSHTLAVRNAIFQHLAQQTRTLVDEQVELYLVEMATHVENYAQFKKSFLYWTFAVRPRVNSAFVHKTLEWMDRHQTDPAVLKRLPESLLHLTRTTSSSTPSDFHGGAAADKSVGNFVALFSHDLQQLLVRVDPSNQTWTLPGNPADSITKDATRSAYAAFRAQTSVTIQSSDTFLGQRLTPNGSTVFLYQLRSPTVPGQVMGKPTKWISAASTRPAEFSDTSLWNAAIAQFPPDVRVFSSKNTLLPRRVLLYNYKDDNELAAVLAQVHARTIIFVLKENTSTTQYAMRAVESLAHPISLLPAGSLKAYVKRLGIQKVHLEQCDKRCAQWAAEMPKTKFLVDFRPWNYDASNASNLRRNTKVAALTNPALVKMKPGQPGFLKWFHQTYAAPLAKIGKLPFECLPNGRQLYRSQQMTTYLAGPKCPAIKDLLVVAATGTGKTLVMQTILSDRNSSDMPKIVLVPTPALKRNFYQKLLNDKNHISVFARKMLNIPLDETLDIGELRTHMPKMRELLAFKTNSQYQLVHYKTYLKNKAKGVMTTPFGTEPWSPGSPLRCETIKSVMRIYEPVQNLAKFEADLKAHRTCVPVKTMGTQAIFKPEYRYDFKGTKNWEKTHFIKNPFDYKIIVIDEIHELFNWDADDRVKRAMLRLMIQYAHGGIRIGLTATPLVKGDTTRSQVLDLIKGPNATKKNSEGFVSYFYDFVPPLFPTTIPRLFQRLGRGSKVPVLGRVILSPLYGANMEKYIKRVQQLPGGKIRTKDMRILQTFLNSMYLNGAARKHHAKLVGKNLEDFAAHANKLHCLDNLLAQHPTEKTLVLFAGGARSYEAYVKKKYPKLYVDGNSGALLTNAPRIGFMFALSDAAQIQAQSRLMAMYNQPSNLHGEQIRVLCVNAQRYGTGVDFEAVRRIILVNVPDNIAEFLQWLGRMMRSCVYSALPRSEQNVHVDLMIATLDKRRKLEDLIESGKFNKLQDQHQLNPGRPVLTVDEMNLHALYKNYDNEMGKMQKLFGDVAIDKPWLQNLIQSDEGTNSNNDDVSKYVVVCDSTGPLTTSGDSSNSTQKPLDGQFATGAIRVPPGQTDSLNALVENLNLPAQSKALPILLDPSTSLDLYTETSREAIVHALMDSKALALVVPNARDLSNPNNVDQYVKLANTRWHAIRAKLTTAQKFNRIVQFDFRVFPKESLTVLLYRPDIDLTPELLQRNLDALASALGMSAGLRRIEHAREPGATAATPIEKKKKAETGQTKDDYDLSDISVDDEVERTNNGTAAKAGALPNNNAVGTRTVIVQMYFPRIKTVRDGATLEYAQYKHVPTYVNGVLSSVRGLLSRFFDPHNRNIKVQGRRDEIYGEVRGVPEQWLTLMEPEHPKLYDQLAHMDRLGDALGFTILPYNSKIEINTAPVTLAAVGIVEPRDILALNSGNVYLESGATADARILVKKSPFPLPTKIDAHAFQSNAEFRGAQSRGDAFAFLANTNPPKIVPTAAYASVKEFATRASNYMWHELWHFAEKVQRSLSGQTYLSTDPIPEHAYFSLNVVDRPGYPAWQMEQWQQAKEREARNSGSPTTTETPIFTPRQVEPAFHLPPIEFVDDSAEAPIVPTFEKAPPATSEVVRLIILTSRLGSASVILGQRPNGMLELPGGPISTKLIGNPQSSSESEAAVHHILRQSIQPDALPVAKITWLRTKDRPLVLVKLREGAAIDQFGPSPNGRYAGRVLLPVSQIEDRAKLVEHVDLSTAEILTMYLKHLKAA